MPRPEQSNMIDVAVVRCLAGNHTADIEDGAAIATGPASPFRM